MILGPDRQKGKKGEEKYRDKIERDYLHRNTIAEECKTGANREAL